MRGDDEGRSILRGRLQVLPTMLSWSTGLSRLERWERIHDI